MTTDFIEQLRSGVGPPAPSEPPLAVRGSRHLLSIGGWDKRVYTGQARDLPEINDLIEDLYRGNEPQGARKPFEAAPELVEGLFHLFHKAVLNMTPKRALEREVYPAHKIIEQLTKHPRLRELQEHTISDVSATAMAIDIMGDVIREMLERVGQCPPPPQPQGAPQPAKSGQKSDQKSDEKSEGQGEPEEGDGQEGDQSEQEGQPGQGEGEQDGQGDQSEEQQDGEGQGQQGGQGSGQDLEDTDLSEGAGTGDFEAGGEDSENQGEADWEAAYDEALDGLDLDKLADDAIDGAADDISDLENVRRGIGCEDGEWKTMDPTRRLALAKQFRTPEMKGLAWVLGQMKRFALGIKRIRINDVPHEAYDVELGNDLRRVLPGQYGLLGHPLAALEFYRRYALKELLIYKKRGKEKVGKGPIVIAIDKSGSMDGAPMRWAMAVAEALRQFALEDDRDYYAIFFGSNNDRTRFDFPGGAGTIEKILAFLGTVANGGTDFDGVLTEALEHASTAYDDASKGKADIILVTDGRANLSDEWIKAFNAERARVGVQLYSVYIGGARDMVGKVGPLGLLKRISDVTIPVRDLKPQAVQEIFQRV